MRLLVLSLIPSLSLAAASPSGTVIQAGSTATITDSTGIVWGINANAPCTATWAKNSGQVSEATKSGVLDATTCAVLAIAYVNGVIWQENTSKAWYPKNATGWGTSQTASPIPAVAASATLNWQAPTQDTNGATITVPLTYNVYRGSSATTLSKLTTVAALTYVDPAGSTSPVTYCYAVTAVQAGQEGAQSNVVCGTIQASVIVPAPPSFLVLK